jgi:hypothetical protein
MTNITMICKIYVAKIINIIKQLHVLLVGLRRIVTASAT